MEFHEQRRTKKRLKAAIIPAGQWGRALAGPLTANGHQVRLWIRRPEALAELGRLGLPKNLLATSDLSEALADADMVILAPAAFALREVCRTVRSVLSPQTILVSACKSLEPETGYRMSQVIAQEIPFAEGKVVAVSGPNFAAEVVRGLPAVSVAACRELDLARLVQDALMTSSFRLYTNSDITGVELGGALKNVMAIAVGIADGLALGYNARAALITRGLAEMARLGVAAGANPLTFAGVSGLGDLVLTCTGNESRNRRFGLAVGQESEPKALIERPGYLVEGIRTTQAARILGEKMGVEMPITGELHAVLFENKRPRDAVMALMTRSRTDEWRGEEVEP